MISLGHHFRRDDQTTQLMFGQPGRSHIPPLSEAVIQTRIDNHHNLQPSIVEPLERLNNKNVVLAKSVSPTSYFVQCRMLNPSSASVFLKKRFCLGTFEPIDIPANSLNIVDSPKIPTPKTSAPNFQSSEEILAGMEIKIEEDQFSKSNYAKLTHFIAKNRDIFATKLSEIPGTDQFMHKIETTTVKPIRQRIDRTTRAARREIERQTEEMLKMGIISESDSPWSAPVLLKENEEQRYVMDYRKLNDITVAMYQPLPTMDKILDCMSDSQPQIFSSLDMRQGYRQIPVEPQSRAKTAFSVQWLRQFQFNRMPFGLKKAAFSLIQMTSSVLRRIAFKYCLAYLNDILVYSSNLSEHLEHLDKIFKRLRHANLRLHPKKCKFALPGVKYLGHILSKNGVSVDHAKVAAVKHYPRPTNLKTVRGYLGLSGYFRRFI